MEKGKRLATKPADMLALNVARLECRLHSSGIDYIGSEKAVIVSQRYSPFEIGDGLEQK